MTAVARRDSRGRIGLALAGGGALAAVYEIGALVALEDCIEGLDLTSLWSYVGVSAGSVVASCLANGITPRQMLDAILDRTPEGAAFRPDIYYTPAHRELARRGLMVPGLIAGALRDFATGRSRPSLGEAMLRLARALPTGVFDNEPIRRHFHALFTREGRTDDFRQLGRRLTVVAADLDSGEPLRFGAAGLDDIPISQAIQASTAVPGVYPPVRIDGHNAVDGVLLKTVHASVALEQGVDLLLCVNPIVPVNVRASPASKTLSPEDTILSRGLPAVLSQTLRTLIHSRLTIGIRGYSARFPNADVVLLEPRPDEYGMFFANIFSFRARRAICEIGYRATRDDLYRRAKRLAPVFARHGLTLHVDLERDLWSSVETEASRSVFQRLDAVLHRLEDVGKPWEYELDEEKQ